jgi:hypothetical protein
MTGRKIVNSERKNDTSRKLELESLDELLGLTANPLRESESARRWQTNYYLGGAMEAKLARIVALKEAIEKQ